MRMSKAQMEHTIVQQMRLFDQDPTTFESERFPINVGGYDGYIRRIYLNRGSAPTTKYDVEYRISMDHYDAYSKKNRHTWGAFIYINRPDYLNYKTFKSIKDTDYGVEWVKW